MEIIVKGNCFEDLFVTSQFQMDECVYMPVTRDGNLDGEEGRIYYFNSFLFCESTESHDFFIMKITKTADKFTQEECDYVRNSKGLPPNVGINAIDAYVTGFDEVSPFSLIYDSRNIDSLHTQDKLDAVNILQEFSIDNVEKQIDVAFENNMIQIRYIKE